MRTLRVSDILFLVVEDVIALHEDALDAWGGTRGIRDPGLLESAAMAAQTGYYATLAQLAAVYARGIAKNHAFIDANKRTALMAAGAFLEVNGFPLRLVNARTRLHPSISWAELME